MPRLSTSATHATIAPNGDGEMRKMVALSGIGVLAGSTLLGVLFYQEAPSREKPAICWVKSQPIPNGTFNVVRCAEAKA